MMSASTTCATASRAQVLASGEGLPLIGKLLGHAHVSTTSRYAHLADDPIRAAADRISRNVAETLLRRPAESADHV
jgi:hypothetical protein